MPNGNGKNLGTAVATPPSSSILDGGAKVLREHRMKRDNWYNVRSRFGGTADPVVISSFVRNRGRLKRHEAEALFEFEWMARRVIELLAKDSTREWVRLSHEKDPKIAEKLRQEDRRLKGQAQFREAIRLSRLHGGDLLVMGIWDGRTAPEDPLVIERIQNIAFSYNVDRWLTFPRTWYRDVEEPNYGEPETYLVHRLAPIGSAPSVVHESRVIRFDGNALPPLAKVRNWGWGASVLDEVYDALRNWGMANQAAASIIPSFITYAMKIGDLQKLIANGDWATIQQRVGEAFAQMSTQNMMVYGPDEEIQKMGTPISGLPDLMDRFMKIISGAVDIPMSVLFQAESGGLGGTASQTDRENWFDSVSAYQETYLQERVRRWLDMIGIPLGIKPGEVEFEFVSLKQLTPTQEAELYSKNAQADQTVINSGMAHAEQLTVHRFGGKMYNPGLPVFDTEREEKIVEEIKNQPIDMGSQDQFGIPFSGDVEPPEGEGGPEGGGGGPGQERQEALDNSALLGGDLEMVKGPEGNTHVPALKDMTKEEEKNWLHRVAGVVGDAVDKALQRTDRKPVTKPVTRKMTMVATRREDGSLAATIEEAQDTDPKVHEDIAQKKHILHPGSRGGHIIGHDAHGEPIYGRLGEKPSAVQLMPKQMKPPPKSKKAPNQKKIAAEKPSVAKEAKPKKPTTVKLHEHGTGTGKKTRLAASKTLSKREIRPGSIEILGEHFNESKKWGKTISDEANDAIGNYTGIGYENMVKAWMKGDTKSEDYKSGKVFLDAIEDAPTWKGTMYRGMTLSQENYSSMMSNIMAAKQGKQPVPINVDAMQSFSRSYDIARDDFAFATTNRPHRIVLHVEGSSGKMIEGVSASPEEAEVIMKPKEKLFVHDFAEVDEGRELLTHIFLKGEKSSSPAARVDDAVKKSNKEQTRKTKGKKGENSIHKRWEHGLLGFSFGEDTK